MDKKIKPWLFIAYEMYVLNKSKEELDRMGGVELIMEMDEFDRWAKEQGFGE